MAPAAVMAAGALLGIVAPLLSAAPGLPAHVASLVLSAGWAWAALAFAVGLTQTSRVASAVLACASLVVAVIAYYVTKAASGDFRTLDPRNPVLGAVHTDWGTVVSKSLVWCVIAVVLGSLLGLAGNLAQGGGLPGLLLRLVVPVIAVVDTSQRLRFDAPLQGGVSATTWAVVRCAAVVTALVLIGHAIFARRGRS
ncbi:hypothetical protein [Peterkaempfera griseoplana]|uniref:hypothetical protein n=1 Tax=Peterkaempfera griseoplana TaxID=66896 RepID=UPI0012FECA0E|nr:hypothetical protein [Peterkaempfera griseoplana]